MPRFYYIFSAIVLADVLATTTEQTTLILISRTLVSLSIIVFYILQKREFRLESWLIICALLTTLLCDYIFLIVGNAFKYPLFIAISLKQLIGILLLWQDANTKIPKIVNIISQTLLYSIVCGLIYYLSVTPENYDTFFFGANFILMGILFALASFRKVDNRGFSFVFLGLFLLLFGAVFGIINYQWGFHSFAHIIDRVFNDFGIFFFNIGFIKSKPIHFVKEKTTLNL
ncbi:MAG: hypothetical protein ACK4NY_13640 [Spirosomataceae bacterium]